MIELRLRNKIPAEELEAKVGKIITEDDYNVLLTRACRVRRPDGQLLCVYLPGALAAESDAAYPILTQIRATTENRGYASGAQRVQVSHNRSRAKPIMSSILGAFEASGMYKFCRLTAFTARQVDEWDELGPLFRRTAAIFKANVPDRFANQAREAGRTNPDWVIPGTPFTTITVNNTYPTGVHTDKGDLDEGFSCLSALRRGVFTGGRLVFPQYRVAVDMQDGDLVLMDAHEWHANTPIVCACGEQQSMGPCKVCDAERISVVYYFRTNMVKCGTLDSEQAKRLSQVEARLD